MNIRNIILGFLCITAFAYSQTARHLFPGNALEAAAAVGADGKMKMIDIAGQPFPKAMAVSVAAKTKNPWDMQCMIPSIDAVTAGEKLTLTVSLRAASGNGYIVIKLQDDKNMALIRQDVKFDGAWKVFTFTTNAPANHPKGGLTLAFFLGMQQQEIEIGGISLVAGAGDAAAPAVTAPAPAAPTEAISLPPLGDIAYRRFVMFKFDDFKPAGNKTVFHARFRRVVDHALSNNMHVSFGIICNSLEADDEPFMNWAKSNSVDNGGSFEFWHHGYTHGMGFTLDGAKMSAEFSGPPYEYQSSNFSRAMKVYNEKTGLTFHTFGSAGNATDTTGVKVLEENPDIKVWLYGDTKAKSSKLVLGRTANLEYAVGKVATDKFIKNYQWQRTNEYFVLQGHPAMWTDESWAEYTRIVEVLKTDKFEFVTPYEFYSFKQQK
ncbi:MAG: hypothetical protein HZC28_20630 [Spirochaetes bacterium]|nr:hypothetical protein [Spirochaetota bacterium]